jgi:hypothetical protein
MDLDLSTLLSKYGLSMTEILAVAALVTFSTALMKKHLGWQGKMAFVGAVISTIIWTAMTYLPVPKPVAAGVFVLIVSTGGWQTLKDALGKIGEDNLKPAGSFNRGPDKIDGT